MTAGRREPVWLSWSSGKDSAWALHELRRDERFEVCGLLTTVNQKHERVAMHGVRERLLESQAEAAGVPLRIVRLPDPCTNEAYEACMHEALADAPAAGVSTVAFGDLFLEDIRAYREKQLARVSMQAHFPLWGRDTRQLANEMVAAGARAVLTCVDPRACPREFVGRTWDADLLRELPAGVDPCGENGEFHSFAFAGPAFARPIDVRAGEVVERGDFVFADLIEADKTPSEVGR